MSDKPYVIKLDRLRRFCLHKEWKDDGWSAQCERPPNHPGPHKLGVWMKANQFVYFTVSLSAPRQGDPGGKEE